MKIFTILPRKSKLTSSEFYLDIFRQVQYVISTNSNCVIKFDFNNLERIDPIVIPNLLCLGKVLKLNGYISELSIEPIYQKPSMDQKESIYYFLTNCGFFQMNKKLGIFELTHDNREELGRYNKMLLFDFNFDPKKTEEETKMEISGALWENNNHFFEFVYKYIFENHFIIGHKKMINEHIDSLAKIYLKELILNPISQLCQNSSIHGKSHSFASLSYIRGSNAIKICVSDYGVGFENSIMNKIDEIKADSDIPNHVKQKIFSLIETGRKSANKDVFYITICVFYRYFFDYIEEEQTYKINELGSEDLIEKLEELNKGNFLYGLNGTVNFFLHNKGIVRIHSGSTQIILTNRMFKYLNADKIAELPEVLLANKDYNLKENLPLKGVHIELELDLENLIARGDKNASV